jgi:multidrug efflux pump subunit AcrB
LRTIEDTSVSRTKTTLALYLAAAAVYVVLGVVFPELLLSWIVGVAYLLAAVWLIPALARRLL